MGHHDIKQFQYNEKLRELGQRKAVKAEGIFTRQYCMGTTPVPRDDICRTIDVAVITLDHAVDFTYSIRPLCMPKFPDLKHYLKQSLVTGWGTFELPSTGGNHTQAFQALLQDFDNETFRFLKA